MNSVNFDNLNSWSDFSLVLNSKEIEPPTVKKSTVDVLGKDGSLDLTEYFGEPYYNNRNITLQFTSYAKTLDFVKLFSKLQNKIHGQKMRITFSEEPDFYYVGRLSVNKWKSNKNIGVISVDCDCEPFKYKLYETKRIDTVVGHDVLTYVNLRKTVTPVFTVSAPAIFVFNGKSVSVSVPDVKFMSDNIVFTSGANLLDVTGNTTVKCTYQEASL